MKKNPSKKTLEQVMGRLQENNLQVYGAPPSGEAGCVDYTLEDLVSLSKKKEPQPVGHMIGIVGRRWTDHHVNTYHSVEVFKGGEVIASVKMVPGHGDHYITTGMELLAQLGEIPQETRKNSTSATKLKISCLALDVKRKKDL